MEYGVRMGQELMGMNGQWAMGSGHLAGVYGHLGIGNGQ